jgi:hypothetical protein
MNETGSIKRNILQVIPTDNSFAQVYLHEPNSNPSDSKQSRPA